VTIMLRKPKLLPLFSLLAAGAAMAQQTAPVQPAAPVAQQAAPAAQQSTTVPQSTAAGQQQETPRQELERGAEPPLIPPKGPTTRIVERKVGNQVTEATVTAGGSTYTLRPKTGTAETGEVAGGPSRAPLWSVLQFGQPKPKEPEQAAEGEQQSTTPTAGKRATVPPPPPMTPPAK
jgi:hypothetical protein